MWTNVFKIGGLHQVSWFQYLPNESDPNISDRSVKNQRDFAAQLVLSSHLQLQKDGFLSTWGNSFVGPWDPSQGLHNPDEKIKLWLFIPGRHSSPNDKAKAVVSKLRVLASGVWMAPGDSEEVAAALSQALRNCIERALVNLSYMRFGDVFSRYHPSSQGESFRRGRPMLEFIFTATEEAVFVHVIISAKHVRALSNGDMEAILKRTSSHSSDRLPVIVSPHGMRGRLTGFCPGDLVKQLYFSSGKFKASNGIVGLPNQMSQSSGCQLRGQKCYLEVTLGCESAKNEKPQPSNSNKNISKHNTSDNEKGSTHHSTIYEKTFIYPAEAVLVPVVQTSSARSSLKRFWLQNWMGPSLSSSSFSMQCDPYGSMDGSWHGSQHGYNSSGNSNSSSISTSTSSDSDYRMTAETGDLEADADSLSCIKSGLTSADQMHVDGSKMGSKRTRTGMTESYGQGGAVINEFGSMEVNNDQSGSQWDWDDDDRGMGMDIQALLSEFGDFGDFFENDALPFGEPPGTEESQTQTPMFSATDGGDASSSPFTGMMDASDQILMPLGFSSFESFNPPSTVIEESISKNQEVTKDSLSSGSMNYNPPPNNTEFEYLIKAEAMMTFAPEYGAVETLTLTTNILSSVIKSPYVPKSRTVESANSSSNNYIYSSIPPKNDTPDDKLGANSKGKNYYTHVESGKVKKDEKDEKDEKLSFRDGFGEDVALGFNPLSTVSRSKSMEGGLLGGIGMENLVLSSKIGVANELECIMFQAFMCRIRHTLLASNRLSSNNNNNNTVLYQMNSESNMLGDNLSSKYDIKKKEIPIRIAGDMDTGLLDGPLSSPVGVWRTVGVAKGSKAMSQSMETFGNLGHNSYSEEGMLTYGQRQPLLELLDGMCLLFQQAMTFVDVTLDADCGDGPYGWLAMQEQWRRGFSCGPGLVHAGCGGVLAACHSLDIAGVELADPLSADIPASYAITLLQSDIKLALKSAFGNFDGPLSVTDWCKGRNGQIDGFSAESSASINDCRDSSSTPTSPSQSAGGSTSCLSKDGNRVDDVSERRSNQDDSEQQLGLRPALLVVPIPAILVGYQDDWLKTSPSSLQHWEKAPFEPYAMQKHMNYCVVCPDIDPLTTAAADFFQQLDTVYETCKLGTHSPQNLGNQNSKDSVKWSSSGFVLLDCPQSMKIESDSASLVGSISDYFLSLSNGWDLTSFLKSLSKVLKTLKLNSIFTPNSKEGNTTPCTVIYVVCPFPEPVAVLKTVVESCVAIGSATCQPSDKERRSALQTQVFKALSCSTAVDEASISNIVTISGFSVPKLVLQIITVDSIFRVTTPSLNEPIILKEIAFTVYNKARRISRGNSGNGINDSIPSVSIPGRSQSQSGIMQMNSNSPIPGMWKDSIAPRMVGQREGEWDSNNSWQMSRPGDPIQYFLHDELKYMFEPLFILADSPERGIPPESLKGLADDGTSSDTGHGDGSDDGYGSAHLKAPPSLHCCYGWTEDWRWLVCIWTDSRGELLDSYTFPFGGISGRQDTKGLQFLFVQILQQGCQILQACSPETATARPRDFVITRIGCFFELECQEWQKALYSIGGSEVKKWSLQLRRSVPDGIPASSNGGSEMGMIQDRNLSVHGKGSGFMKGGGMGQVASRKQILGGGSGGGGGGGHIGMDGSKGLLQWVQSITFVSISVDHSLQLVYQADSSPGTTQGSGIMGQSTYTEGFTPVKSLGSTPASYIFIPSPTMRFLPPNPLQLPTCLTSESPPLAHLLHSKGSAIPISTGFVVSKSVPSMRKDSRSNSKQEWPSILSVALFDYYGGNNNNNNTNNNNNNNNNNNEKTSKKSMENHVILDRVAAELHALSWMTVSPGYLERRTSLPFHCDMVLRLRRLLHFADKELSQVSVKSEV